MRIQLGAARRIIVGLSSVVLLGACAEGNSAASISGPDLRVAAAQEIEMGKVFVCIEGGSATVSAATGVNVDGTAPAGQVSSAGAPTNETNIAVASGGCTLIATSDARFAATTFRVSASLDGTLVSVTCNQGLTAPVPDCEGTEVTATANAFHGSVITFVISPHVVGCTLTQGFFKNHEEDVADILSDATAMFVSDDNKLIISFGANGVEGGGDDVKLDARQIDAALESAVKGDFRNALLQQLIAAELNVANDATVSAAQLTAIRQAQELLAANPTADSLDKAEKAEASRLNGILSTFNEGGVDGANHCDDNGTTA
ncbi:MAG: hypothetical protein H0U13_11585 [Gemmatimonadaceae bacterium]|nr:hypothetical protein [Gemmatimonadaceae bacterium]